MLLSIKKQAIYLNIKIIKIWLMNFMVFKKSKNNEFGLNARKNIINKFSEK